MQKLSKEHRYTPGDTMSLGEKLKVTDKNLARLDAECVHTWEKREVWLWEKTRALEEAMPGDYTDAWYAALLHDERFTKQFSKLAARPSVLPEDTRTQQTASVSSKLTQRLSHEQHLETAALCRQLAHAKDPAYRMNTHSEEQRWRRQLADILRKERGEDEDEPFAPAVRGMRHSGEEIAYLRNAYTDAAFHAFSEVMPAKAVYYSDFPGVCEAVYYKNATACILPLSNSVDGRMLRFYSLLARYDLRIAAVCRIPSDDGETSTTYALLRRGITIPVRGESGEVYLECRLHFDLDMTLDRVCDAAALYGLRLARIDSAPLDYDGDGFAYDVIFSVPREGDIFSMLVYLYLLVPQFTLFGIYTRVGGTL